MCVSNPMSMSMPASSVDASTQPIKSAYALSPENKKKNAEMAARNRAASLVSFGSDDSSSPAPTEGSYQVGTTGTFAKRTYV